MIKKYTRIIIFICLLIPGIAIKAQVVTVTNPTFTTPALAATYTSLANAVTALNGITAISGVVTITLNPGNLQIAPAGGYVINFTSPTTAAKRVIITGSNNTILSNGSLVSGTLTDAFFKVVGVDFLTIQNFAMQENPANTTSAVATNNMTEWGVALLYASATNGAQNNTIQNNTITLNKNYSNTFGIYSNTRHTATTINITADVTSTAGANSNNNIYGNAISNVNMGIAFIGSGDAGFMDLGNDIGGASVATANTITNWGGLPAGSIYISNSGSCYGIFLNNQKNETVSFNTITSATVSGTSVAMRGIFKTYASVPTGTFTSSITNNVIRINHNFSSGVLDGIRSEGISTPLSTATININDNRFQTMSVLAASSSTSMVGITNTSQCGVLNINNNIFRGANSTATTGGFTAISNTGAVQTAVNINGNQIGDASGNAITFSAATSGALTGITCPTIAAGAALSISNNNFQGFVQSVAGSGAHTYITYTHAANTATTDNINSNTFTNLVANTSADVNFISRSGTMALLAGATNNCNNNNIVTGFSKPVAGGVVTLYNSSSGSLSGNTMVQTGNDFSNISITGATTMNGWSITEGGLSGPTKTVSNNVFSNWICGTNAVTVLSSNFGDNNTIVSGNTISSISAAAAITAISLGNSNKGTLQTCSGNTIADLTSTGGSVLGFVGGATTVTTFNISNNTINGLSSSNAGSGVTGIRMLTASTANVFKNKIYDLSASNATGTVSGLDVFGTALGTYNINNNLVGDLRADLTNSTNAIRGINLSAANAGTAYNVFYNTVYINALAGGTNFGTSAISATVSGTAANGALNLRNNILVNTSLAKGTGLTVAYRRSGTALNNFANSSNNNIFYAGTPAATNLIFSDGLNFDQTLAGYQTRVAPRDAASFTELPPFISTIGSSPDFLHVDPNIVTQAESGAVNIATYTDDFDGETRQGNPGYTGAGSAPDIGADEMADETNPPVITFTQFPLSTCITTDRTLTGVTITDATGVPLSGGNRPRIYYRKNTGSWFSQPGTNTGGTAQNGTWSFTIVVSDMGGVTGGDVVRYYIIAQDLMPTPNVGSIPSAGLVASSVNSVTTPPTTPKTYTILYTLNGTYTVGSGGNFTTITAAVNAYNSACSLAGPVVFELIDNAYLSESYPLTILNHVDASVTKTLTIRPSLTASPSFGISVSDIGPVFELQSAKHIIIDGRRGGIGSTKSMTLFNLNTGVQQQTLVFSFDAQQNTIKFCTIKSRSTNKPSIQLTGNVDNNTIDNNSITDASDMGFTERPLIGIFSSSASVAENNVITNNDISNYLGKGIWLGSECNGWTITGNRFFQATTRIYTGTNYAILIESGSGYTISNNRIGFANTAGSGSSNMLGNNVTLAGFPTGYSVSGTSTNFRFVAISCDFDPAGPASNIDGNTIGGIAIYTSSGANTQEGMFCGISVLNGNANIGTIAGNTIGATTGNNSIYASTTTSGGTVVGIYTNSTGTVSIQNNNIGGITASGTASDRAAGITAINTEGTANYTISNNFIGNADAGNMRMGLVLAGASLSNVGTLTSTSGAAVALKGIVDSSTGNSVSITGNTLRGWQTSASETTIRGIESAGTLTGSNPAADISNNFLGTAATGWGSSVVSSNQLAFGIKIHVRNQTSTNVKHNDFRGIGFTSSAGISCISLSDTTAANNVTNITGNTFTSLAVTTYSLSLIEAYQVLGNNAVSNIDSNKTVGTFSFTGTMFGMIGSGFVNGTTALRTTISHNEFSNAVLVLADDNTSVAGIIGASNSSGEIRIEHNSISNVTQTRANFYAIGYDYSFAALTDTAIVSNNSISNIAVNGIGNYGIFSTAANNSKPVLISNNSIKNLSLSRATDTTETFVTGIELYSYLSQKGIIVKSNEISSLSSSIDSSIVSGVLIYNFNTFSSAHSHTINANKIYDLAVTKPGARVAGIYSYLYEEQSVFPVGARRVSIYNNIVGDLRAPAAGNNSRPSITGISIENNRVKDTINIYHNTVDLRASGSHTAFSSAAVYTDTLARINSYGNIFNNISTPGATGKTVAYWRKGTNLANFDGDYNSLYAGTPAANRLIYFDGTNSDQTLTAYKTRVGAIREVTSVTELPVFVSLSGSNAGFLHLDPNANCGLIGKAINLYDINELFLDFDNDFRPNFFQALDIGADETAKFNTWNGASSTNWNDPLNWSLGTVPNGTDRKVTIPAAPTNQPVIGAGEIFQVRDISVGTGASLTNMGTLKVAGNISGAVGGINNTNAGVVVGSIEMNGLCSKAQTLVGNRFTGNNVKNLTITTEVTIPATAGQGINLWGALNFGFMLDTLTTNGNLTLKSTAASTASIGVILAGNLVKGDVTVERFINTGTTGGAHGKTWQFLSTPTTGQTIRQAWQENGTAPAGFGTIITGTGTGFDITTVQPSMKFYNDITNNWTAVTNTNNPLRDSLGYMIFVRGDRSVTTAAAAATPTVLRSKGVIYQDSNQPPVVPLLPDKFQSVGNPYASRIEFNKVRTQGSIGMLDVFYVWDPTLAGSFGYGGYQTITGVAGYVPTVGTPPTGNPATVLYPAGVAAPYIESGQAFFVRCRPNPGGIVVFGELNKATGNRLTTRLSGTTDLPVNRGFVSASLFTQQGNIADGNIVAFENGLSNALNENDADKMMNPGENFGIMRDGKLLAVEARDAVREIDTVFYNLQNLKQQPYQFRFAPASMPASLTGYLIDRYTNTNMPVSMTDSSFIDFMITDNPASYAADRFILVFKQAVVVPVKIISIRANRNQDQTIRVDWKVDNEINIDHYDVERSAEGRAFVSIAVADPTNSIGGSADYYFNDAQPLSADNFYRIKAISKDGQVQYSPVAKISAQKINSFITIYPNPIIDNKINIRFINQQKGNYTMQLTNKLGQLMYTGSIYVDQDNTTRTIQPNIILASGTYQLNIIADDGKKLTETIIVP